MEMQKRKSFNFILFVTCLLFSIAVSAAPPDENPGNGNPGNGPGDPGDDSSLSHEKYFTDNLYEGTQSCLGSKCHDAAANDVLMTGHWNWQGIATNIEGVENEVHGKKDLINNFCVAVPTNEGRCAQCHIGYGYIDQTFDFTDPTNIDCLICHDQTDSYVKGIKNGGLPNHTVDELQLIAQSVDLNGGVPGRINCVFCHANAGGGDNIKHGDLSMSMVNTTREFDVHMGTDGGDMTCVACHDVDRTTGGEVASHGIGGMPYHSVDEGIMKQCDDCHDNPARIHTGRTQKMIDTHERLACQVCHIPAIARFVPTKVEWYWSEAGDLEREVEFDENGKPDYSALKGEFVWAKNVRPTLRFHNGKWHRAMININDIALEEPVDLGSPAADRNDPDAMIYPFKKMIGNQVVDANNDAVLVPHLFGKAGGPNPYWGTWDWNLALWDAFNYPTGQTYTGEFGFVDTTMLLSVNHEIAPKEQSLGAKNNCSDCHAEGLIDWPALGWDEDPFKGSKPGKPDNPGNPQGPK